MTLIKCDICVIGAGSGGLSVAAGAAQLGRKVVLIEKGEMGGDCLNTGCVPSKSLISAARARHEALDASRFGISVDGVQTRFADVMGHVHGVIDAIAPHDSVERFESLGVTVIKAAARFLDRRTVEAGETQITARRFVIATGSRAALPPVPGLDDVSFLTNESVFDLQDLPDHLLVLGGGPIGVELSQAFRRLGSAVTLLEGGRILGRDDPDLVEPVRAQLIADGIDLRENTSVEAAGSFAGGVSLSLKGQGTVQGSHLLVAAGRKPNVEDLGLDAAGVAFTPRGIAVDARLRTSNKKIFAIGDVAGGLQFTHVAGYHAGIVIRNALFRVPAKADHSAVPRVTYSDPELGSVGLSEADARKRHGRKVRIAEWPFAENDRAMAEGDTRGHLKVVIGPKGRILGAGVVGRDAGEILQPWILALSQGLKIGAFTGMIAPYPTRGEVSKRAAGAYYTPTLFSARTRFVVRLLSLLG